MAPPFPPERVNRKHAHAVAHIGIGYRFSRKTEFLLGPALVTRLFVQFEQFVASYSVQHDCIRLFGTRYLVDDFPRRHRKIGQEIRETRPVTRIGLMTGVAIGKSVCRFAGCQPHATNSQSFPRERLCTLSVIELRNCDNFRTFRNHSAVIVNIIYGAVYPYLYP